MYALQLYALEKTECKRGVCTKMLFVLEQIAATM
jgi:hypothetical protein